MKKTFVLGLLLLLTTGLFAAEKRIAVFETAQEGLTDDEINWIPSSVRRRLEANINDYTMYQEEEEEVVEEPVEEEPLEEEFIDDEELPEQPYEDEEFVDEELEDIEEQRYDLPFCPTPPV